MRIVHPEDTPASLFVQRQGIAHAMRSIRIGWHTARYDLHPEAAADLRKKAVEVEKSALSTLKPRHRIQVPRAPQVACHAANSPGLIG